MTLIINWSHSVLYSLISKFKWIEWVYIFSKTRKCCPCAVAYCTNYEMKLKYHWFSIFKFYLYIEKYRMCNYYTNITYWIYENMLCFNFDPNSYVQEIFWKSTIFYMYLWFMLITGIKINNILFFMLENQFF